VTTNIKTSRNRIKSRPRHEIPDLQTQYEALLDCVWDEEADWRLDDRIDLATRRPRRNAA
jgi:hypothetical protein